MNRQMIIKTSSILIFFFTITSSAFTCAQTVFGVWQTEPGDSGGYLHVEFNRCDKYICALIVAAYDENNNLDAEYINLGKMIVWDMQEKKTNRWNDGEIWDPEKDKTYSSKMKLVGEDLEVSGCIAFICRSQVWKKVDSNKTNI